MGNALGVVDRVMRALFVSLAVGLGWGIRGDFGHIVGAMYPGAALGLAFAYVSGQRSMFRWAPILGAAAGLGIGAGGHMSYGVLHGYAQSDTFINYAYGFFTLFLQGGAWGIFACAAIGLILEREPLKWTEWAAAAATVWLSGWLVYVLVVTVLDFHINPPRSDASIGYTGGALGLLVWLKLSRKPYGFKGALLGYIGFGLGMAGGRLLGNAANASGLIINHWNVMEVSVGLIGGFLFAFGMLGKRVEAPSREASVPLLSLYSMVYVMTLIPLLHRLGRINAEERLADWARNLGQWGYEHPEQLADTVLMLVNGTIVLGMVGTIVWVIVHAGNRTGFAWFPVIFFSGVMVLFQNITALYPFYPRQPGLINMHSVFLVLYGLMVLYVLVARPSEAVDPDDVADHIHWPMWAASAVMCYLLILGGASMINGESTMKSANTRWPVWSWRDGPFPGLDAKTEVSEGNH